MTTFLEACVQVGLGAGYMLPIPGIVEAYINAIVESGSNLNTKTIKTIALIFGLIWPLIFLYAFIKAVLEKIGIE